jgi:hypothetical protein
MKLIIRRYIPNTLLHTIEDKNIWVSSHLTIYLSKDECNSFEPVISLENFISKTVGRIKFIERLLRLDIRLFRKLESGTLLVITNRKLFKVKGKKAHVAFKFRRGVGPLREGLCEDNEGNCYMGEYFLNKRRMPVYLFKSSDDGENWKPLRIFHGIRHIHFAQFDPFSQSIWVGTGDRDEECCILYSMDKGRSWNKIGLGSQLFRATNLVFTEENVYWGTDAPNMQNYIVRFSRKSRNIKRLHRVNGPVYSSTMLENGVLLFATGVEGGSGELDRRVHIWASSDDDHWYDLFSRNKDWWPYIFGFGQILFAHGQYETNTLYFTTKALKKMHNFTISAEIKV